MEMDEIILNYVECSEITDDLQKTVSDLLEKGPSDSFLYLFAMIVIEKYKRIKMEGK